MKFSKLVDVYRRLEETQSNLEMTSILAEFYSENEEELEEIVLLSMGRSFAYWKDLDLGISSKTMVDVIQEATGRTGDEIEDVWREEGDLGSATEKIMEKGGGQQSLMQKELTVERVNSKLEKIARMGEGEGETGSVSMDKKKREVAALLNDADPEQGKYIVRIFLENLRLGVGEGTVRDALAEAFFDGENSAEIQRAYDMTNDFKEVAVACRDGGLEALQELEIELFRPINSMLAKKVDTIEEGFEEVGRPAAIDWKYDGMRAQLHKKGDEVKVYTRRLEDVSKQFPDVVEAVRENVKAEECIIDAEVLGYNPEDGSAIEFQKLSKRIKRKYDIEKLRQEIPVEVRPFDLIYSGESMLDRPYSDRWSHLLKIVEEEERQLRPVDHTETGEEKKVQEMQQESLASGHEGIMMKSLDAEYRPGKRVGYMVKLKPVMETLDLAIIGAKWSEGRRSGWLGRLKLGCWDEEEQEYRMIGRMATGLTDEQLQEITEKLEPLIVEEDGRDVKVRPEVIVEVEYEEIQSSPDYDSGYALRFPRLKQFREDKEEADSLEKVENLFEGQ